MMQTKRNKILCLTIGAAGVWGLYQTLSFSTEQIPLSNSFFSVWFCVLSAVFYEKVCQKLEKTKRRQFWTGVVYSMALAFALTAGKQLETVENLNIAKLSLWGNTVLLSVYFLPFVLYLWQRLEKEEVWEEKREERNEKKSFRRYWLILFLCWIPVFLAFYPGAFVYDACEEYVQVASRDFTTHHPLAHVLLLGGFVCSGKKNWDSYNLGIALYTLFQMFVLSGVFSYTLCYIRRKIKKSYVTGGLLLWYGFFPVFPMYAVCSSKDTIFTAAFLIVVIKMLQFFENTERFLKSKREIAVSILSAVVMMLFRNNGVYAYVVWGLVMLAGIWKIKKERGILGRTAVMLLSSLLLFGGCSRLLQAVVKAEDSESQEIMTVPIQQMVRTYVYSPETYTQEEQKLLFEILPEESMDLYNARLSDLVKSQFQNEVFRADRSKYLKLWIRTGLKKPMLCLNAWLMTSYGYWYPDALINVYKGNTAYTFTYTDSSYFGFETEYPGTRESKFPWLEEQYRRMSLELYQQKIPGISMLFSPGFFFWIFMFVVCFLWQKHCLQRLIPLLGILFLWLTAVLGPTYLVRYVLILWFAFPVYITAIWTGVQGNIERIKETKDESKN